jgi:hypothetical protein
LPINNDHYVLNLDPQGVIWSYTNTQEPFSTEAYDAFLPNINSSGQKNRYRLDGFKQLSLTAI